MSGYSNALLAVAVSAGPAPVARRPKRRLRLVAYVASAVAGVFLGLVVVGVVQGLFLSPKPTAAASVPALPQKPAAGDVRVNAKGVALMLPARWRTLGVTPEQVARAVARTARSNPGLARALKMFGVLVKQRYVVALAVGPSQVPGSPDSINVGLVPRQGVSPADVIREVPPLMRRNGANVLSADETVASGLPAVRIVYQVTDDDGRGTRVHEGVTYAIFGKDTLVFVNALEPRDDAGRATPVADDAAEIAAFVTFR
jgi:hypothetical protein